MNQITRPILASPRPRVRPRWPVWALAGVFVAAILVRLPLMNQSLWYDEIATLRYKALQPVRQIVAGPYTPNNHILYSLLAKASLKIGKVVGIQGRRAGEPSAGDNDRATFSEFMFRLPSLLAGSAVGVVVAWPMRRRRPGLAIALALAISFHPWVISYSVEGRGYALALLLCALATNALPRRRRLLSLKYSLACAAALYTVPVCLVLIAGHGVAMLLLRRRALWTWARSTVFALALAGALYLPLVAGMRAYAREPAEPTITYGEFLFQLPRFAVAGESLLRVRTVLTHWEPDDLWLEVVGFVVLGAVLAARLKIARPALVSFGTAVAIAVVTPTMSKTAGEVRFVPWLAVLASLGAVGWLVVFGRGAAGRVALVVGTLVFAGWGVARVAAFRHTPVQPLRDATELVARAKSPGDSAVIVCYMAAKDTAWAYGRPLGESTSWANSLRRDKAGAVGLLDAENQATGPLWVIVPYPRFMKRDTPELWQHVQTHYSLYTRLPGRVSPVDVYRRTDR